MRPRLLRTALIALSLAAIMPESRADKATPPAPEISLRVFATTDAATGKAILQLAFATSQQYSCMGYTIPTRLLVSGKKLRVQLGKAQAPTGPCATAFGPAKADLDLPPLDDGDYTLALGRKGKLDLWRITITPDAITLHPENVHFSTSFDPETQPRKRPAPHPVLEPAY